MKIYVASSWRNPHQQHVVAILREAGHEVYDFRHPEPGNEGFHWSEIDPNWEQWNGVQFAAALNHPIAVRGFCFDMEALATCDVCVLVMPCGRSSHLELGYAAGAGKKTFVLLQERAEPELMLKMCHGIAHCYEELVELIEGAGR